MNRPADAVTDAEGKFFLAGISEGSYRFVLSAPDVGPYVSRVVVSDGELRPSEIALPKMSEIQGVVVDAAGRRVAGEQLILRVPDQPFRQVFSDGGGRFRVSLSPEQRGEISAMGFLGSSSVSGSEVSSTVILRLERPRLVAISVKSASSGMPLRNIRAAVTERIGSSTDGSNLAKTEDYYSSDGYFRIPFACSGLCHLEVNTPGYDLKSLPVHVSSKQDRRLAFRLRRLGMIRGVLLDSSGDSPVCGGLATWSREGLGESDPATAVGLAWLAGGEQVEVSGRNGRYTLYGVSEGPMRIFASASGFAPASVPFEFDGKNRDVKIRLIRVQDRP